VNHEFGEHCDKETLTFLATAVLDLVSELIDNIKKRSKERGEDD